MSYQQGIIKDRLQGPEQQWPLVHEAADFETWKQTSTAVGSRILTVYGQELPKVPQSQELLDYIHKQAIEREPTIAPIGLIRATELSPETGCFLGTGRMPKEGGYIGCNGKIVLDAELTKSGSSLAHRVSRELYGKALNEEHLTSEIDVDHMCRCTACWNPWHTESMSSKRNNELRLEARNLERSLRIGQLIMPTTLEWFDDLADEIAEEPEGGYADVVICTRYGPYRLQRFGKAVVGRLVICEARSNLRPAPPRRHKDSKIEEIEGQQVLEDQLI